MNLAFEVTNLAPEITHPNLSSEVMNPFCEVSYIIITLVMGIGNKGTYGNI